MIKRDSATVKDGIVGIKEDPAVTRGTVNTLLD